MRVTTGVAILLSCSVSPLLHAVPQGANLVQQLQSTYVPTVMDGSGIKVAQAGSILVVQPEGIMANPAKGKLMAPYANLFVDGQVKPDTGLGKLIRSRGISSERALAAGEKVYLLKTEVKDNAIAFTVQSCGTCDPKAVDPAHQPYKSLVTFKFLKGALAVTNFAQVQQVIEQVFKFPEAADTNATAGARQPATQAPQGSPATPAQSGSQPQAEPSAEPAAPASFEPIAPPPPPPAAPKKIELGQTADQVKGNFGEPDKIVSLGDKVIYIYKDLKVTFVGGKVSDIDAI